MPIRLIDKWSVGKTPTGATETVALPGTQKLSVNRTGKEHSFKSFARRAGSSFASDAGVSRHEMTPRFRNIASRALSISRSASGLLN